MPFFPIRNDITCMQVDAIVNAANRSLLGGGGVDGAIHRAAGPELLEECRTLGGCGVGEAKITRGYDLPAKYVIHTVGPIYRDGRLGEETLLRSCYRKSLELAAAHGLESIAFPLISAGAYGYPRQEAVSIACEEIESFLKNSDMTVYLVFYDRESFLEGRSRYPDLQAMIEENQVRPRFNDRDGRRRRGDYTGRRRESTAGFSIGAFPVEPGETPWDRETFRADAMVCAEAAMPEEEAPAPETKRSDIKFSADIEPRPVFPKEPKHQRPAHSIVRPELPKSLAEALRERDESFAEMLFRCIDASGMSDAECYHRANIDKRVFSKIRSKKDYKPSKPTVIAFAVALKLDREQTDQLLRRASLALNGHDPFDIIVDYFISKKIYDIFEINNVLFEYDQQLLGGARE